MSRKSKYSSLLTGVLTHDTFGVDFFSTEAEF